MMLISCPAAVTVFVAFPMHQYEALAAVARDWMRPAAAVPTQSPSVMAPALIPT